MTTPVKMTAGIKIGADYHGRADALKIFSNGLYLCQLVPLFNTKPDKLL